MSKKDTYYFSHDSNARRDPKIIALIDEYGGAGYGWFWIIIEVLREQEDYTLDITKGYIISSLSAEMKCSHDEVLDFINRCIELNLLESDGVSLWSNSLNYRMSIFNNKRKRYSEMAKKRWNNKDNAPNRDDKEDVEKIKKENIKSSIKFLEDDETFIPLLYRIIENSEFKNWSSDAIIKQRNKAIDYIKSKDKRYKNYESFFKNWLRSGFNRNTDIDTQPKMVY